MAFGQLRRDDPAARGALWEAQGRRSASRAAAGSYGFASTSRQCFQNRYIWMASSPSKGLWGSLDWPAWPAPIASGRFLLVTVTAMVSPNAADIPPSLSAQAVTRLVEQFSCLAEVAEQLTYRLVDLEERLAEQQQFIVAIREEGMADNHGHPWQERLDQTDLRLAQIETLLGGEGAPRSSRGLALRPGLVPSPVRTGLAGLQLGQDSEAPINGPIFPEESEQPFMDDDLEMPIAG